MASIVLFSFLILVLVSPSFALDKLKFGIAVRVPGYDLPLAVLEEQGIWKKNGLEVESFAFTGGGPFTRAIAAKGIMMGFTGADNVALGAARGLQFMIVTDLYESALGIWVDAKGPIKAPKDLAGARIGLSSLGSLPHAYGQVVIKAVGLEGKVRFVAVGGIPTRLAALKTGAINAHISPGEAMVRLQQAGEARELVRFRKFLNMELIDNVTVAHKELISREPATVTRAVKSVLETARFMRENPAWLMAKISQLYGHSPEVAKLAYDDLMVRYTRDGKVNPKALENLFDLLVTFELLAKDKVPKIGDVYTAKFLE